MELKDANLGNPIYYWPHDSDRAIDLSIPASGVLLAVLPERGIGGLIARISSSGNECALERCFHGLPDAQTWRANWLLGVSRKAVGKARELQALATPAPAIPENLSQLKAAA